jgi:hypothetical protein
MELTLVSRRRNGNCCSDLVLSKTAYMIGNACLSQPKNHSRDMVVEPVHSIGIVVGITLCLLNVVLLGAEELMLPGRLPLRIRYLVLICYLEILLPAVDLEESLTSTVECPNLIPYMESFRTDIASTLLLVRPSMFLLAVLSHQT